MKGLIQRFEEKFIKKSPDECWEWKRAKHRFGYGRIMVDGYNEVAHRLSFKLYKGNPGELFVLHKCDNPLCVNPNHLFLGTNQDNMIDMAKKGRKKKKISNDQVKQIRALNGIKSVSLIAKEFGASYSHIHAIIKNKKRIHV